MDFVNPLSIPFVLSYLFWGRGICKSKNSDLILGAVLLIFASVFSMLLISHSGGFCFIGKFVIIFGIISLVFFRKIDESQKLAITKKGVKELGILTIILGMLFSVVA